MKLANILEYIKGDDTIAVFMEDDPEFCSTDHAIFYGKLDSFKSSKECIALSDWNIIKLVTKCDNKGKRFTSISLMN